MRWIHIAAAILFFISAALQYNDPDPLRWIAIYGAAGAACLVASHPRGRWLGAAVGLISLFWAASYAPRVLPDLAFGDLVKPMHEKTPQIEDGREMLGLLIIAVWMGVVALVGRGRGRGKPVAAVALLVLGSWAVSPPSIAADRDTEGAEEPRRSGYVETATVQGRTIALEGVSTTVVEREELERFGAATVAELMRFVPGVDVVAAGGRAGLAYAHIRGGDPDFTVVMLDGVPLNDATDQLGGAVNLNTLPADTVERIEVVRGPLSAVYGATGLAGAINIITRRGTTDAPALSASLETGDADLIHGAFSISRGGEDRDFFVGVTWDEEEGRVGDESFEQFALQGNGSIPLGDNASLRLSGRVSTWDTLDYPEASGGPEADTELRDSEHTEVSLAGDLRIGGGRRDHALYLRVLRHDTERTTPGFAPGAGVLEQVEDQTYVNATLGWSVPLIERSERRLIVGAELGWEDGENDATFGGGPVPFELDRKTVGAFVEFVSQSGPLQWEVAARLDDPEDEDLFFSPRASLAYRPGDGRTTLRASAGRAFDLPSFFALATPLGGNPELESEIALGGDLGVAHTFLDGMFDASLELFYVTYDELIDFLLPPEVPPENIGFVNRDEVTTQGAELQVTCKPHPRFEVAANVTYQDTEIEGTDEKLRQRPEWIGGLRIHWRPIDALSWQVDAQGVSEMADASLVITDRFETEGFEIFGSALSYDIARQWQLRARVDNILDEEYETFIGFPGPGRSYRVGLRFHTR